MILASASQAISYSGYTAGGRPAALQSEPTQKVTVTGKVSGASDQDTPDRITLSENGMRRSHEEQTRATEKNQPQASQQTNAKESRSPETLSTEEQQAVQKLKIRDAEVRAHEQAHLATAGQYAAGGPSFSYQTGPDGRRYAVGGEVPIDVGKEKTPEETIQKMRIVRRAALAPANPSSADLSIAAAASMKESQAVREMNSEQSSVEPTEAQESQNTQNAPATTSSESASENRPEPVRRQDFQALYA